MRQKIILIKKVTFKNCVPFSDCIIETNNTQINLGQKIDVVMSMYNLIEYSDAYSETSGNSWQYYRDKPAIGDNAILFNFLLITIKAIHSNLNNK